MYKSNQNGRGYLDPVSVEPEPNGLSEAAESRYMLSLREILEILWKRLWLIVLVALVITGAAWGFTLLQAPVYEASVKLLVGQDREVYSGGVLPAGNVFPAEQLTQTMVVGVKTRPVAEAASQQLDSQISPEELLGNLSTEQIPKTQFIDVKYRDSSPERAQRIANAVGNVFPEQVSIVNPGSVDLYATVWEQANRPNAPISPDTQRNVLLGLMLGLMLGVGLALLLEYLDDSWRSPEEAERISGAPTFAAIPELEAPTVAEAPKEAFSGSEATKESKERG